MHFGARPPKRCVTCQTPRRGGRGRRRCWGTPRRRSCWERREACRFAQFVVVLIQGRMCRCRAGCRSARRPRRDLLGDVRHPSEPVDARGDPIDVAGVLATKRSTRPSSPARQRRTNRRRSRRRSRVHRAPAREDAGQQLEQLAGDRRGGTRRRGGSSTVQGVRGQRRRDAVTVAERLGLSTERGRRTRRGPERGDGVRHADSAALLSTTKLRAASLRWRWTARRRPRADGSPRAARRRRRRGRRRSGTAERGLCSGWAIACDLTRQARRGHRLEADAAQASLIRSRGGSNAFLRSRCRSACARPTALGRVRRAGASRAEACDEPSRTRWQPLETSRRRRTPRCARRDLLRLSRRRTAACWAAPASRTNGAFAARSRTEREVAGREALERCRPVEGLRGDARRRSCANEALAALRAASAPGHVEVRRAAPLYRAVARALEQGAEAVEVGTHAAVRSRGGCGTSRPGS